MRSLYGPSYLLAILLTTVFLPAGAQQPAAEQQLDELFADEWALRLREYPLLATSMGVNDYNDRLSGVSFDDIERRKRLSAALMDRLQRMDIDALPPGRRLDYELFEWMLRNRIESAAHNPERIPFIADSGFHSQLLRAADGVVFRNALDYENFLERLRAIPGHIEQHVENMRAGITDGFVAPVVVLDSVLPTVAAPAEAAVEESAFFRPFARMPSGFDDAERTRLESDAREVIGQQLLPAFRRLAEFLDEEYRMHARESLGASELPRGRDYYRQRIRAMTTLDLSPEDIHAIGLAEVARIRSEMLQIVEDLEFEGGIDAFVTFLRTDPRFYAETEEELLSKASLIAKKADGLLPGWFGLLPRMPYGIMPMPAEMAPTGTTARYWAAPPRRQSRRVLLGKYLCAGSTPPIRVAGADRARGDAGTSSASGTGARAGGRAGIPAGPGFYGFCRRMGAVHRVAGCGDGDVHHPIRTFRKTELRDVACLPAGDRHRHPRDGLESSPGRFLPGGQHFPQPDQRGKRNQSLHCLAGPGAGLQTG